jgi:hypothetical protein
MTYREEVIGARIRRAFRRSGVPRKMARALFGGKREL